MRTLIFVCALGVCFPVSSDCLVSTETLTQVRVYSCNGLSMSPDRYDFGHEHLSGDATGVLVSGLVLQSKSVFGRRFGAVNKPDMYVKPIPKMDSEYRFFLSGTPEDLCPTIKEKKRVWVLTKGQCCDEIPPIGECQVPFPVVEIESKPEELREWRAAR